MQSGQRFPIEESNLFKLRDLEMQEIAKLKWTLSEEAGTDVGWDRAEWVWLTRHRAQWKASLTRRPSGSS